MRPTVCELEGPIPILKRSKTLMDMPVPPLSIGAMGGAPGRRITPSRCLLPAVVARSNEGGLADGHRQVLAAYLGVDGGAHLGVLQSHIAQCHRLADAGAETAGGHRADGVALGVE